MMQKRMPSAKVTAYKVHTIGVSSFRRCGIEFTGVPQEVPASMLNHSQVVELLNTETLHVEEIGMSDTSRAPTVKPGK